MKNTIIKALWYIYIIAFLSFPAYLIIEIYNKEYPLTIVNILTFISLMITIFSMYSYVKGKSYISITSWKIVFVLLIPWNFYLYIYEMYLLLDSEYWLSWVLLLILILVIFLPSAYTTYKHAFKAKNA